MIYFSVALLVVALVAVLVGVASMVQIYRIGDAGAQSVWSKEIAHLTSANEG
ncbi:hypothetical protein [Mycobacterium sp. 141]|uniref:hypothetical protein n=1 Tax=Mycobacterium sp. 141 TaxID=1120797 RepID=UPI00037A4A00